MTTSIFIVSSSQMKSEMMSVVAANFFQAGVYDTNVVDILVGCAVNALNVNLNIIRYIWQENTI